MKINQYQLIHVNLEPTLGREINKTSPSIVISPDEMNHYLRTIVIAPITSTLKNYPTRVNLGHDKVKGMVAIDQIRTIDKQRIINIMGSLNFDTITQIKRAIEETYVK